MLAVWRQRPFESKHQTHEHLDNFYDAVFTTDLNSTQGVLAVQLTRMVERRARRTVSGASVLLRLGSDVAAMLIGQAVLSKLGIGPPQLDAELLKKAKLLVANEGDRLLEEAVARIGEAVHRLCSVPVSPSRLASLFKRGELLAALRKSRSLHPAPAR